MFLMTAWHRLVAFLLELLVLKVLIAEDVCDTESDCDKLQNNGDDSELLHFSKLNQEPGRPQSMLSWKVVKEDENYFVENINDRNERFLTPNGGNFVNGVPHPPFILAGNWALLRDAMVRANKPTDIWVTTFPKCGTTYMEQIILLLLRGGDASQMSPHHQNHYNKQTELGKIWPEVRVRVAPYELGKSMPGKMANQVNLTLDELDAVPNPRVFKTHAPRHMFLGVSPILPASLADSGRPAPLAPGIKVVYVSRNAKDACVSAYYHGQNPQKLGFPFDAWAATWMSGIFEHGRWSDHVAGWRNEFLNNPNQVLWVRYEDLLANPESEIKRVASFLQISVSDEVIVKTMNGSHFTQMQPSRPNFFRKGVVGDARRHFSSQLDKEFNDLYREQMRGVSDPYAD